MRIYIDGSGFNGAESKYVISFIYESKKLIEGKKVTLKWAPRDKNYAGNLLQICLV